jgi:hypothetical protein
MKKPVLIMITAALCMLPIIASAADIVGKYKMIASGSCIHSENGYDVAANGWITAKPGIVYAGTTAWRGTWNFYSDGTGTYSDKYYATVTPPPTVPPPGSKGPPFVVKGGIRVFSDGQNTPPGPVGITYTYDEAKREITVFDGDAVYKGDVSLTEDVITLLEDNHVIYGPLPAPWWSITCNTSRTLIYVGTPDSQP